LRRAGAEIVVGDLGEPDSLRAACRGVRAVVSAVPGPSAQPALIDAAREAAVVRFVYVSLAGLVNGGSPLERETHAAERRLHDSGLASTILRPAFVMDAWLSPLVGFDLAARRVRVYGRGDARVTWIAAGDVADVAVACVDAPVAGRATVELCGPDSLSPLEIVELAEQIGGRPIEVEHVPLGVFERGRDPTSAALLLRLARGGTMAPARLPPHLPKPRTPVWHFLRRAL
jgi:NADH dehydrogenase